MTTLATVLGLLPLVISPGAGSELYRGLGAVLLGGMLFSTLVTLVLMPVMLGLCFRLRRSDSTARDAAAGPASAAIGVDAS